jgi:hypothetical protein
MRGREMVRGEGLSLPDRLCMALGSRLDADIWTAEGYRCPGGPNVPACEPRGAGRRYPAAGTSAQVTGPDADRRTATNPEPRHSARDVDGIELQEIPGVFEGMLGVAYGDPLLFGAQRRSTAASGPQLMGQRGNGSFAR